jgi:uncharacterized protein (DUF2164 family)
MLQKAPAIRRGCLRLGFWRGLLISMIEIKKEERTEAVSSLQRYFEEDMPEPLGTLSATLLLDYFLEEIGPLIYNQAIADAQARVMQRIADLNGELYADAFQYWAKRDAKNKRR